MVAQGVHNPAVIHPTILSDPIRLRIEGFSRRFHELKGGSLAPRYAGHGKNHLEAGYAAALAMADDRPWPDGVLCPSDLLAYGLRRVADEKSISIPAQCCAVGIDGNPLNSWLAPWLTSIRIPYERFGDAIVGLLLNAGGTDPSDILLDHVDPQ